MVGVVAIGEDPLLTIGFVLIISTRTTEPGVWLKSVLYKLRHTPPAETVGPLKLLWLKVI